MTEAERGFFQDADYRRFGGPDARARNCTPGTVSSISGANLPSLNSSCAAIPKMATGQTPQLSDFASTAGTANLCNRYANGNGYPSERSAAIASQFTRGVGEFGVNAIRSSCHEKKTATPSMLLR